jgi:hypothetical protein
MKSFKWMLLSGLFFAINVAKATNQTFSLTVRFAICEDISADEEVISTVHDQLLDKVIDPLITLLKKQPEISEVHREFFSNQTIISVKATGKNKRGDQQVLNNVETFIQALLNTAELLPIDVRIVPFQALNHWPYERECHVIISKVADLGVTADWMKRFTEKIKENHSFSSLAS